MAVKKTPWSYMKGDTPLHRLPAGSKLAFLLFLSLAVFIPGPELRSIVILAIAAVILAILSFSAGLTPWQLMRGSRPLFLMIILVFLIRGFSFSPPGINPDGLKETAFFGIRIALAFSAGTLFFSVTTSSETNRSLSRLEKLLHADKLKLALRISLMLGFLKDFFVVWEDLNLAWKARGGKKNLSLICILMPLAIERMMQKAAATAEAMAARSQY